MTPIENKLYIITPDPDEPPRLATETEIAIHKMRGCKHRVEASHTEIFPKLYDKFQRSKTMAFEEFIPDKSPGFHSLTPSINTSQHKNVVKLVFNRAAVRKWNINQHEYAKLYFNLLTKEIGIGFIPERVHGAYKLSRHSGDPLTISVAAGAFFKHYNLNSALYRTRPLTMKDNMLVFGPSDTLNSN